MKIKSAFILKIRKIEFKILEFIIGKIAWKIRYAQDRLKAIDLQENNS